MTPGRLIYLIGPSGAGKDTLLGAAAQRLGHRHDVCFPRRIITRPRSSGYDRVHEQYDSVAEGYFRSQELRGEFLVTWRSHGLAYGLPVSIRADLAEGRDVVVNGSRDALERARAAVPRILPVYVWADGNTLGQRLRHRAREDETAIEQRIERGQAYAIPSDAVVIDNSGNLDEAIERFCRLLAQPANGADTQGRVA